jgi:antirestriction protein
MKQTQVAHRYADDTPRIYVTSLVDHETGHQHGCWIDGDQGADAITEKIRYMLAESGHPDASQWAITDSRHFGDLKLAHHSSIDSVAEAAFGITEYGPVFASLLVYLGGYKYLDDARRYIEKGYRGAFNSAEEYAKQRIENLCRDLLNNLPDCIRLHIDYKGIAFDMMQNGDIFTLVCNDKVHVFDRRF